MYSIIKEDDTIVFYYYNKKIDIDEVMEGEVPFIFGKYNDKIFFLMTLFVPEHMRYKGIASNLLLAMAKECGNIGCRRIDVDDFSGRFLKKNNIYIKCGFKYLKDGYPEMYTNPKTVINKFYKKI